MPARSHGLSNGNSAEYRAWQAMKTRCTNPNFKGWADYGGRGITVCPEWTESFEAFFAHVGERPGPGYSLDRIDNDRGYEPGNVRWSTKVEQMLNRRKRTHCWRGHALDDANTYHVPGSNKRRCRKCHSDRDRRYKDAKKASP